MLNVNINALLVTKYIYTPYVPRSRVHLLCKYGTGLLGHAVNGFYRYQKCRSLPTINKKDYMENALKAYKTKIQKTMHLQSFFFIDN